MTKSWGGRDYLILTLLAAVAKVVEVHMFLEGRLSRYGGSGSL